LIDSEIFIGIDIGSSSTKAVAVTHDGCIVGQVQKPNVITHPQPGFAEMDVEKYWWGSTLSAIKLLLENQKVKAKAIKGIGLCSIGASFSLVDQKNEVLRPGILYGIDSRASEQIAELNQTFGEDALIQKTGRSLTSQSVGPKIMWVKHHEPNIWKRADRVLTPVALVSGRLCGVEAIDPHTALTFDPFFDPKKIAWDSDMVVQLIGQKSKLPEIRWPGESLGFLTESAARLTGLPAGIAVACGTADVTAEAIGSGVREEGDLLLMYGSTLFILQRVNQFIPRPSLWPSFLLDNSQPTVLAGTSNAGSVLDWVLREIHSEGNVLAAFESASKIPPGCEGLICLPYFAGERSPIFDPYASGIFLGLRMHHTRAHMLRAVMEGIGYSFRNLLDNFGANGVFPQKVFASGGGTNNRIWTQIMSDISGVDQQISRVSQGAAIGAAYLGGMAAGVFKRNQSMPQTWLNGHTEIKVSATAHKKYSEQYSLFLEAYQKNKILMHQLVQK